MLAAALLCFPAATQPAQSRHDLPAVGHSRFDELVGGGPVPFPFARLVERIERQMERDRGGLPAFKVTLIPLGRSLQRGAGGRDPFRYPRVVAAADGETRAGFTPLKDRLFIGYHEQAGVLEVISYNDDAGRFEFQVVQSYRAGAAPRITYARRELCLACHQNGGPIFARPLWDETSANPAIAKRLRATGRDFYGVRVSGTDIAYFIDAAADRANLFSVWQTLWQEGCGQGTTGDACRREAFAAALAYARDKTLPSADALAALDRTWSMRWARGLALPNADLPNRSPLAALQQASTDPLLPRPPLAHWHTPDKTAFVVGLAGMLDGALVARLGRRELDAPLDAMLEAGDFSSRPFARALMLRLLAEAGRPVRSARPRLPTPRNEPYSPGAHARAQFSAHCASCHDTTLAHPPNFLHGTPDEVEAKLDQCAPRIHARLSAVEQRPANRAVSPMPPAAALARRGITPHLWLRSKDYAELKRIVAARLGDGARALRGRPYEGLPPCLGPPTYARKAP